MTKIALYLDKTIEQNAAVYYEKAKKTKKKLEGAKNALNNSIKKLKKVQKKQQKEAKTIIKKSDRKKEWYEKFRWFISSDNFLVIGGRDATTNEIVIKKHTDEADLILHSDIQGSPFFVIKSDSKKIPEKTIEEAAQAAVTYSKAWKLELSSANISVANPTQVDKKPRTGEYIEKGAFMIHGKTETIRADLSLAIGVKDNQIMGGPIASIKKHAEKFMIIEQGKDKASDIAKKIKAKFGGDIDEIIRFLPSGGYKIVK